MAKPEKRSTKCLYRGASLILTLVLVGAMPVRAAGGADPALVKEVASEVMRQLQDSGALRDAVRQGIQEFVRAQQEVRARAAAERVTATRPVSAERDHIFGNPNAEVSLIEYSDFECPFCKRFHPTARALVERYQGKVNWVYRHFPLSFHKPGAQKEAEASECATEQGGNQAFWRYADAIFERTRSNGKGFPIAKLVPLASEQGLDSAAFRACLESGRMAARVNEDFAEGVRIGITGTPGNVLRNNRSGAVRLRAGAVPIEVLSGDVAKLLK